MEAAVVVFGNVVLGTVAAVVVVDIVNRDGS